MKSLIVFLFIILFTLPSYALPQRTIVDPGGDGLLINSDGTLLPLHGNSVITGRVLIDTPGTAKVVGSQAITEVSILALASQSSTLIYIGNSAMTTATGMIVSSTNYITIRTDNLSDLYIDGDTQGNGITYIGIIK